MKRYSYKLRQHKEANNKMDSYFLQNEIVEIHPGINNAYISLLFSKIDVKIPKPDSDQMDVEITSFAGKLNIELPTGVTVICKGRGGLDFSKEVSETGPVINLIINDMATSLNIGFDGDSDESSSNQG
ncbi:MAG: hypothetical protein K5888_04855 [Lachnospiraceae bacterium]|nr:hypothetical protein [Lachnospiraceae bacterium]